MSTGKKASGKSDQRNKTKEFTDPHKTGTALKPGTGSAAVEITKHLVNSASRVDITHPNAKNAGSHDDKVRYCGDEKTTPWAKS